MTQPDPPPSSEPARVPDPDRIELVDRRFSPFQRRHGKKILVASGLLVVLVILVPTILSTAWVNSQIREWLGENVGSPVEFASLDVSWTEGVTLTGLEVRDRLDSPEPLLTAPRVELDVRLWSLLFQQLDVKHFVVIDPVIRIAQREEGVNTDGVVRTKKAKRRRRREERDAGEEPETDEEPESDEEDVLPDVRVPIEIRNATLIFVSADGHEARREGVGLTGNLSTRSGTSTFDLQAPGPDGSGLSVTGRAQLFEESGLPLPTNERSIDADVVLRRLDAATHRDLLGLFLDQVPDSGVLDGSIAMRRANGAVTATVDLTLTGVSFPGASSADADRENLRVVGSIEAGGTRLVARELRIQGEGLDITADVEGTYSELNGTAELHVDLARAAAALRAIGIDIPSGLAGRVDGQLTCSREPSLGKGRLTLRELSLPPREDGVQPIRLDDADVDLVLRPGADALGIERIDVSVAETRARLSGRLGIDGSSDVSGVIEGNLASLSRLLRSLDLVPEGVALDGRLTSAFSLTRAVDAPGPMIVLTKCELGNDGYRIEATGTAHPDGTLEAQATGSGDLARLLASYDGADGALPAVPGTFDFAVSAAGARDAPAIVIERFKLDGDVRANASGRIEPNGDLQVDVNVGGLVAKAMTLARRLGVLEGEVLLDGSFAGDAQIRGTRETPIVPLFDLQVRDGSVAVSAKGSLDAVGGISGTATIDAALDDLASVAHAAGMLERPVQPGGRLVVNGTFAGTRDAPQIPAATIRVTGPLAVNANVQLDAAQQLTLSGDAKGALQPLADVYTALSDRDALVLDGTLSGSLAVAGPLDALRISLPLVEVTSGGLRAQLRADRNPDGSATADLSLNGPLEEVMSTLHEAGIATDMGAAGDLTATLSVRVPVEGSGDPIAAAIDGLVRHLSLLRATDAGSVFSEPELRLSVKELRYDHEAGALQSAAISVDLSDGLRVRADVETPAGSDALGAAVTIAGPLQPVLDAAAFATSGVPTTLDGTVALEGTWARSESGTAIVLKQGDVTTGDLRAQITGSRDVAGNGRADVTLQGGVASLVALAKSMDALRDVDATGTVDARLNATLAGDLVRGSVDLTATDLHVLSPPVAGGTFREPRLHVKLDGFSANTADETVDPFDLVVEMVGARLTARTSVAGGAPPEGSTDSIQQLSLDGRLSLEEAFSANHPELLSGVALQSVSGPFRFAGDIGAGRERAAGWTGGFELSAAQVVAPYVTLETLTTTGAIADGVLALTPLDARVNGGTLSGNLSLGLVGKQPEHRVTLRADNVGIDADLAPLVARAVPLLAGSEDGRASGRMGLDLDLTATGSKSKRVKRTADGKGVVRLRNVSVESTGLVGQLLQLTGGGGALSIPSADVPFVVQKGQVITEDLPLDAGGLLMRLGGQVGLDGALDYALKVKPGGGGGSSFERYTKLFDDDGFLPLRLGGSVSDPDLKLPDVKDAIGDKLGGLWDKLRGKDDKGKKDKEDEDEEAKKRRKRRNKKRKKKAAEADDEEPPPPPPPPR